jgi:folate-binding protein YgfZ
MTPGRSTLLADRGVVSVTGEDAGKLLQGIICNDLDLLAHRPAIHAAVLSPQGKILFEFFVVKANEGFLLETLRVKAAELAQRIGMYKLRAKATIGDASGEYRVLTAWGPSLAGCAAGGMIRFRDPRLPDLGVRMLARVPTRDAFTSLPGQCNAAPEDWHAHRVALGVPEGGKDYALGEAFPHEADFDLLNGVSFSKGCFVGQEVVARMHNRAAVRKRVVPVESSVPLTPGAEILAGTARIGIVGSVAGCRALAMLRLDRAAEAEAKGAPLTAAGAQIALRRPDWFVGELLPSAAAP